MDTVDNAHLIEKVAVIVSDTGVEIAEEDYQECGKHVICVMKKSQSKKSQSKKSQSKKSQSKRRNLSLSLRHLLWHRVIGMKVNALQIVTDAIVASDTGVEDVE